MANLSLPVAEDKKLYDMWVTLYLFPCLTSADELGVFSALSKKPMTAQELGEELNLQPRAVEGVMSVLTAHTFLKFRNRRYALSETARTYLLPESPFYWGNFFKLVRDLPVTHTEMVEALRQDGATLDDGKVYETNREDEERAEVFTRAMHAVTMASAVGSVLRGDFKGVNRILDMGGGSGNFSIAFAQSDPEVHSTLFDLAPVCQVAREYIAKAGLSNRISTVAGHFFEDEWPTGHDAVFFGNIFHNWRGKQCRTLAKNAWDILPSGGRIYLQEMILDDDHHGPPTVTANTLVMIRITQGKQRTGPELAAILEETGFTDIHVHPTFGYYSLVVGVKP